MIKAFIFDLDGVLVVTDRFHYQAWKQIADKMGIHFDEKINNRLRGVSRMESLKIILEKYTGAPLSDEKKIELAEKKNDIYKELLHTITPDDISEQVRTTLKKLKQRGLKLAIGSSSKNARYILNQAALLEMFDAISDGTNIVRCKPDPEVFLKAAEYLGLNPEECIVVEDARAGIDAAKAGNMIAVGIGEAAGYVRSDYRIAGLEELLAIRELYADSKFAE